MIEITVRVIEVSYKSKRLTSSYYIAWSESTPDEFGLDDAVLLIRRCGYSFSAWDSESPSIRIREVLVHHFGFAAGINPSLRSGVELFASEDCKYLYNWLETDWLGVIIKGELIPLLNDHTKTQLAFWRMTA